MEEIDAWRAGLQVPHASDDTLDAALAHDRALLRERLRKIVDRPEIAEALFLASPDLSDTLEQWKRDPESKKGKKTEQALVRYFLRMASRPTPFGLFSGCTAGRIGDRTRLMLAPRSAYRRHSRLDMDYLFALCEHLSRDPEIRAELRFRPNSSLYETAGRVRFAESRVQGRVRTVHLVAIDAFDALRDTLRRAADGARLHDLAAALVASDPDGEITPEDAEAFLHELVDNQLLVPELALPVTGEESTAGLLQQLDAGNSTPCLASDARARLAQTDRALRDIDAAGLGSPPDLYRRLASELEPLGVPVSISRLFQVDLTKPVAGGHDRRECHRRTACAGSRSCNASRARSRSGRWKSSALHSWTGMVRIAKCRSSTSWMRRAASASSAPTEPERRPRPFWRLCRCSAAAKDRPSPGRTRMPRCWIS